MTQSLEKRASGKLRKLLERMTGNRFLGFFVGLCVTAVVQSSSATSVMTVGFVNSGLMSLSEAVHVIAGANVGTTVTSWILSLSGISGDSVFVRLLKPSSFTPVLALAGIVMYMSSGRSGRKETGMILLSFSVLMTGMEMMSGVFSGIADSEVMSRAFVFFQNPFAGLVAGLVFTAIIQSSSASVGILQALSMSGAIGCASAIPIVMGQNIGTCVTALLSSVGANVSARRAAMVHLFFNVFGTVICFPLFLILGRIGGIISTAPATPFSIAVMHTSFNLSCLALFLPFSGLLERLVCLVVRGKGGELEKMAFAEELDERFFLTPSVALKRCSDVLSEMAACARKSVEDSAECLHAYSGETFARVKNAEERTDRYEDSLSTYLLKLSGRGISVKDSAEAAKMLKVIGDFERISDHALNVAEASENMDSSGQRFSGEALAGLKRLTDAICEIVRLSFDAYGANDIGMAASVEPLEQVIDGLREKLRSEHIFRLQRGECGVEIGFVYSDLLSDLERISDHCSNIAGYVLDMSEGNLKLHESLRAMKMGSDEFREKFRVYSEKYGIGP